MHGGTIIVLTYPVDYLPVYFREIFFTCAVLRISLCSLCSFSCDPFLYLFVVLYMQPWHSDQDAMSSRFGLPCLQADLRMADQR